MSYQNHCCVNCNAMDRTIAATHITGIRAAEFGKSDLLVADLCHQCRVSFGENKESYLSDSRIRKIDQSERLLACVARTLVRRMKQGILLLQETPEITELDRFVEYCEQTRKQ